MTHSHTTYGGQSMVTPLRTVLVRRPDESFADADPGQWHYAGRPDLAVARQEHDAFVSILRGAGVEVIYHDEPLPRMADAIYVYDPVLMTDRGVIILQMGKMLRRPEEDAMARRLERLGVPVLGRLTGDARAEGGDLLWLDHCTLAVGLGFRTNSAGLRQLEKIFSTHDVSVLPVELPYHTGSAACLHLLSLVSFIDDDLAVAYPPLLSVPFWQHLTARGTRLIEVPQNEFETMACNVLTLAPRKCVMLDGNPITRERLNEAGCEVITFKGDEICFKAEGGPTCLTLPILRRG